MQTAHSDHGTTFQALLSGQPFRFHHRGQSVIGLKAQFSYGNGGHAAMVLTPTQGESRLGETRAEKGLQPGDLLSADDVGNVVELAGVKIVPSATPDSVAPGANNFAQPGKIELHNGGLIFVTNPQGGLRMRVDVGSGAIGFASGAAPVEIYSEWSVIRTDGGRTETLYAHKPTPAESVTIEVS
jgi:hypothetical protein